ncbi:MAG: DUF1684 domain-containing protein [Geminicoccaceae bacterium]
MSELATLERTEAITGRYMGPPALALADWRMRINRLYAEIRSIETPETAWRHWLEIRSALFRRHPMSPLSAEDRLDFGGISVFAYDPALRFEVGIEPYQGPAETVKLGGDGALSRRPLARTRGLDDHLGAELVLWWINGYGGGLFLPFRDSTSGTETFGGGRYLIDAIKGADLGLSPDGRLILDFNFAYHPSCAFDDSWVCPLAPPENTLPAAVRGGEKL